MTHATSHNSLPLAHPFGMVGDSPALHQLLLQIRRIGPHFRTVLLRGERGAGKDLAARALHTLAVGGHKPFLTIDAVDLSAATTMPDLAAMLRSAGGGTVYVDEVDEMSLPLQAELLRAMRNRETHRDLRSAVRLIASTTRDLKLHCAAGQFRQDLHAHLSMIEIVVPSLRQRPEDILPLAHHFASRTASELMLVNPKFGDPAVMLMQDYPWPGNVRELESVVINAVARNMHGIIHASDLALPYTNVEPQAISREKLDDVVHRHVRAVLDDCAGNKLRAAEVLGISRSTLYRMLDIKPTQAAMHH